MTTFSMYSASIPVFKQILNSLLPLLEKAEAHVADKKIDPQALLQYRLFPDMLPSPARSRSPATSPKVRRRVSAVRTCRPTKTTKPASPN
jgi:hypothetical protein